MGLNFIYSYGQTPLSEEEKDDLVIKYINTQEELNEYEQNNIEEAIIWTMGRRFKLEFILTETCIYIQNMCLFEF